MRYSDSDKQLILRGPPDFNDASTQALVIRIRESLQLDWRPTPLPEAPKIELPPIEAKLPYGVQRAREMLAEFCQFNNICPPTRLVFQLERDPARSRIYALYIRPPRPRVDDTEIRTFVAHCLEPDAHHTDTTWPGWILDYTIAGATMHELGHHVNYIVGWERVARLMYDCWMKERPLSDYASYDRHEDFAEAMRVFINNPTLLADLRPRRYEFITRSLGLKSAETRHWTEILSDNPLRLAEARGLIDGSRS